MKLAAFNGSPAGENGSTNCKILAISSLAEMCIAQLSARYVTYKLHLPKARE